MHDLLRVGIVGTGEFAEFAALAFLKVDGVQIVSVTDINPEAAARFAAKTGSQVAADFESLLGRADIDLVYIGTPPSFHYEQSRAALYAGKHVICEKPAALRTTEAEALAAYSRQHGLLYVVNLMQRYNPLYHFVTRLVKEKWLGEFVHGFFENYASDEKLIPAHWFWDNQKSGGIFIEHGVHFFDMFEGWLGRGELLYAFQLSRKHGETEVIDRVQAVVLYPDGPVNFYHGFNQPKLLDRQELRLQFEKGDITLYEWIPVKIRIHGLLTDDQLMLMQSILPDMEVEEHETNDSSRRVKGNFKEIQFDHLLTIHSGDIHDKMNRYEELVISMLWDQWSWIKDPSHQRLVDDRNAVESLRIAEEASSKSILR